MRRLALQEYQGNSLDYRKMIPHENTPQKMYNTGQNICKYSQY